MSWRAACPRAGPALGRRVAGDEVVVDQVAVPAAQAGQPAVDGGRARRLVWAELLAILSDTNNSDEAALRRNRELRAAFHRAWPLIEATGLVADLWSVPAYLRRCAPWLSPADVRKLQRDDPRAWTVSDLLLLDAARQRLGDPEASRRGGPRPGAARVRSRGRNASSGSGST